MSTANAVSEAKAFVDEFNVLFEEKSKAFEECFWGVKMGLSDHKFTAENLSRSKKEKEDLLSNYSTIEKAKKLKENLPTQVLSSENDLVRCLDIIVRTCNCYATSPEMKEIREMTTSKENELEILRNRMELGYKAPSNDGKFVAMSSVGLRNVLGTNSNEETRKAVYEGLRTVGPFICENGFVEIIKLRNKLAKSLGYEDYYDYKVTNAEGMSKKKLFQILDRLEEGTRSIMEASCKELENLHGTDALKPWNATYKLAGAVMEKMEYVLLLTVPGIPLL
jgi:arsenate reductase-like glutaredoxin family protein